jgi:hypothetical protein
MDATRLLAAIRDGYILQIDTYLRSIRIDAKTVAKFDKANHPVIKTGSDGHLYIASGRKYVDCHYAQSVVLVPGPNVKKKAAA